MLRIGVLKWRRLMNGPDGEARSFPPLSPSRFTSISGLVFCCLFPAIHPKEPALHRHPPCPCDASPCDIALFYAHPLGLSPDSPMNFPVRPDTFCRLLQLTDGLSPQPTHVRSVQSFLLSRSPVVYRPSFPLLSAE